MAEGHAFLSASGASRWLNCTPSARLEEEFPDSTSSFAEEGSLAHAFAENSLLFELKQIDTAAFLATGAKLRLSEYYSYEMETEVQKYVDYVLERFSEAKARTKDAVILIEQKVDLSFVIEEGYGRNDAIIIADGDLLVIDLKFGKGVRVEAENNSQLKLYGLGALVEYELMYDIRNVCLAIVQPRLDSISEWMIPAFELQEWGEKVVKPKAKLAFAGEGLQQAGDWCKWCKAKARCATLAAMNVKLESYEFKGPNFLTDKQLIEVYEKSALLVEWSNAVAEYILKEALNGKKWPGYKLVEGRSVRKWANEEEIEKALKAQNWTDADIMNIKLKGIGDIEKLIGKAEFNKLLGAYVEKPQGKPTIAPISDKRPEFNSAVSDFEDIEIE